MINYSKVVTKEDLEALSEEKYNFIIEESKKHSNIIKGKLIYKWREKNKDCYPIRTFQTLAYDTILKKDYCDESELVKTMLEANINFPSSNMLFEVLLNNKVSYNIILKAVSKIKNLKLLEKYNNHLQRLIETGEIDQRLLQEIQMLSSDTDKANKNLNAICKVVQKYYSIDKYELIIARLVQIVVFEEELYKSMEQHNEPKKTHC